MVMRLRLGSGGSATLSVTGKGRHGAVMVPACSPGSRSSGHYCSPSKTIEGQRALVSNQEQPITTLKSRMELSRPTHKAAVLALPPFERKHLAKTATVISAG